MICGFFMQQQNIKKSDTLIILIGPMGAGKTTVGKLLAQYLEYDFFDSDADIENSTGARISWIFDKEGEAGFRIRETRAIDKLTQKSYAVLATGGGAVVAPANRDFLKRGFVVYLKASVEVQYERTCLDRNRPLLKTPNPKQKLAELFAIRDPIYQELADMTVTTGCSHPRKMVQEILQALDPMSSSFTLINR